MNLILKSNRLLLRPLEESDAEVEIDLGTDPDVMAYVGPLETKEQIVEKMQNFTRRCAGGCIGEWCVIDRTTGEKIGTACLLPLPIDLNDTDWSLVVGDDLPDCEIEVGYMLRKPAWGKGYATEACERLLRFAFEDTPLEEVVAVTDPENKASRRVLEKCGMKFEGMRLAYGEQCPGYRMTRRQWLEDCQGAS